MFLKPVSVFRSLHVSDFCAELHFIASKVPAVMFFTLKRALPH